MRLRKPFSLFAAVFSVLFLFAFIVHASVSPPEEDPVRGAIVKIFTVESAPSFFDPWKMRTTDKGSGSGCVIPGNRIITNAHVVSDSTFLQVQKYNESLKYEARVSFVSHEMDLALVTVDDPAFFKDVKPLEFGELPGTQEEVLVYGYPMGGDSLSITKGVLSRIEHIEYVHSDRYLLGGQIDAAVNPGNSGGPVMNQNGVIGIVMQGFEPKHGQNINYMVPVPMVQQFLKDVEDGTLHGIPEIGFVVQKMQNKAIKKKYGMSPKKTGALVYKVLEGGPAEGVVREGDIVLSIEGYPVQDDCTVEFRPDGRTDFRYFSELKQIGESVELEIFRNGETLKKSYPLPVTQNNLLLVPQTIYDKLPRYFIFGGLVFCPLTENLMDDIDEKWDWGGPDELRIELIRWPTPGKKEVVVLVQVLSGTVNAGYEDVYLKKIVKVNGKTFKNFEEFVQLVENCEESTVSFREPDGCAYIIDNGLAKKTHAKILKTYKIPGDRHGV
jgi:S1-C subfamily serine protease